MAAFSLSRPLAGTRSARGAGCEAAAAARDWAGQEEEAIERTVVIFGAGATKACGGPLTNEILPDVLAERRRFRREHVDVIEAFLVENFNLPPPARRAPEHYPPLPLVLSLVDTALDRDDAFGATWPPGRLRAVRAALEYAIFALLEYRLRTIRPYYGLFLRELYATRPPGTVTVISLNYDLIADNTLSALGDPSGRVTFADYGCDIATESYRSAAKFAPLLKLHGSLNWLFCPNCHRLDLGIAPSGSRTSKVLRSLYGSADAVDLDSTYEGHGAKPCRDCATPLRPVLITPTHLKDYRNPHIARVWYEASRALREATRAIFVGYSLPEDDVDVIYLLKRGLARVGPRAVTVVEHASRQVALDRHPVGIRYRALFGDDIDWHTRGFADWIAEAGPGMFEPAGPRARRATTARRSRPTPAP